MAEKNVILKDGEDILYPKTKAELVEGLPQGGAEWGDITGTLSNQTDLQNALNGKADVNYTAGNSIYLYVKGMGYITAVRQSSSRLDTYLGSVDADSQTTLRVGRNVGTIKKYNGSSTVDMLDADNTAANAPLSGTEADLTSLKLNGTTYKIPSGGGGGDIHLYRHSVLLNKQNDYTFTVVLYSSSSTPLNSTTFFDSFVFQEYFSVNGTTKNTSNADNGIVYQIRRYNSDFWVFSTDFSTFNSARKSLQVQSDTVTQIF